MNSSIIDEISGVVDEKILLTFIDNCIKVNQTEVINYINDKYYDGISLIPERFLDSESKENSALLILKKK